MDIMARVRELGSEGKAQEAIALVERAASDGVTDAMFVLANWRLWGLYGPRDADQGRALLARAAAGGLARAARLLAYLTASGTGCKSDPEAARAMLAEIVRDDREAERELEVLESLPPIATTDDLTIDAVSSDPEIRIARGLLSSAECQYLIDRAGPAVQPSLTIDRATGIGVPDPARTSLGMYFDPSREDLVVNTVNRRIAAATGTELECGEALHILRYSPGQEYKQHLDAVDGASNQRHLSALLYLNGGYEGGETRFLRLGIDVKGEPGDCLIFRNSLADGAVDPRTLHAGLPVTAGIKWLASRWIRQRPHDPWLER